MYRFEHLPAYADFLLKQQLEDYVRESLRLSYEVNLPLLKRLSHLNEAERYQLSKNTSIEFLTYLSQNKAKEQIEESLHRWMTNQLPVIGKYDIDAQDITIVNYVRATVLKQWLRVYTPDIDIILKLNAEIDALALGQNTTSANAYIELLKDRIAEELHFNQNLTNASPGITFVFDLKTQQVSYINGKVDALLEYTPEEILAMGTDILSLLIHPEDVPIASDFMNAFMQDRTSKTYQAECRFKNKQGHFIWLRTYGIVYKREADGIPTQILGCSFEISNEKEIASALLKREKQLLEAQAIAHIGSYEWDIVNDISVSTPELRKVFEADHRQTVPELMENVHPEDREKLQTALQEAFTSGIYVCEYRYSTWKGIKVIDSRGVVTFGSDGKPASMSGTVQDITERKHIEDNLLKKTLELERSNIQLQEFASIASHDLKEPLRKIAMFSDIILTSDWDNLSANTKSNLSKITGAAQRMQQLIEGILMYSAVEAEGQKVRCTLERLLQDALNNLEYRIKDTKAIIHSDGLPDAEVIPFQMQQLFQNLIANALKFSKTEEVPQITITHKFLSAKEIKNRHLRQATQYLQLCVSDNGIGFNQEASEKIFGLFQRLHSKSAYEGSGLGLAICRKIVENHEGAIAATSKLNSGSTFTVILPV